MFKKFISHIYNQFLNDIKMKKLKTDYKKIKVLFNI